MGSNGTEKHWRLQAGCFDDSHGLSSQMLFAVLTLSSLPARAVHMCVHVHVDMLVWVCTGRSEVSVICHFSFFLLYLLRQVFSLNLELVDLARLVDQGISCLRLPRLETTSSCCPAHLFYLEA